MIERNLAAVVAESARHYPIVTVTGPRQSGKTTLCRAVFPEKKYVSLEPFDVREYARRDPRSFLEEHRDGAIIDEVQHAPDLPGYLQVEVDRDPAHGRFVLTGSQHFGLTAAVSQSLAGRTAVLELLPLSYDELERFATSSGREPTRGSTTAASRRIAGWPTTSLLTCSGTSGRCWQWPISRRSRCSSAWPPGAPDRC
jgi:predicted AAA+ superfamily ATPase